MGIFEPKSSCEVPDISSFSLNLLDTDLPAVPDPIFEMPFNLPIPPPPETAFGCFCFQVSTYINIGSSAALPEFTGSFSPISSDCCQQLLSLSITLPSAYLVSGVMGEQGPPGDPGDPGDPGEDGTPGERGYDSYGKCIAVYG